MTEVSDRTNERPSVVPYSVSPELLERVSSGHASLTPREKEVYELLEHSNQQIADHLGLSKNTTEVHIERILKKMEVGRDDLIIVRSWQRTRTAIRTGVVRTLLDELTGSIDAFRALPPRKRQIAWRIHLLQKITAYELGIGTKTVNSHATSLYEALTISRTELIQLLAQLHALGIAEQLLPDVERKNMSDLIEQIERDPEYQADLIPQEPILIAR